MQGKATEKGLIIARMVLFQLFESAVLQVLQVGFCQLHIGCALRYGVFVKAVIACFVNDIQHHLCGVAYQERAILRRYGAACSLRLQQVAKVNGAVGVAFGMTREPDGVAFHTCLMVEQRGKRQLQADGMGLVGRKAHHDGAVGMRGEVLSTIAHALTFITHLYQATIQVELSAIVLQRRIGVCSRFHIADAQGGERLIPSRIMPLHAQLQRVGQRIVLFKQGFAYLWNPLVCASILVLVDGFAAPQRYVVQFKIVAMRVSVYHCAEFSVANGHAVLEEGAGAIVPNAQGNTLGGRCEGRKK